MNGTNTLNELYLGSDPTGVAVQDDQLLISLESGEQMMLPLHLISQLTAGTIPLPEETQLLILRHRPQIDHVAVNDHTLNVYLTDGRLLSCPLAWFPRLLHGTVAERNHYELSGDNDVIHWPDLDEDVELTRLFSGGKSVESQRSIQRWLLSRQIEQSRNGKQMAMAA